MSDHTRGGQNTYSRRRLALLTIGGLVSPLFATPGRAGSADGGALDAGVRVAVHTSSFGAMRGASDEEALDSVIHAITESGARDCEVGAALIEPEFGAPLSADRGAMSVMKPQMMRRELRKWRLRTPAAHFEAIGDRFKKAGLTVSAYACSVDATFSNEEIDRVFTIAKGIGAEMVAATTTVDVAKRMAPYATTHKMIVALSGGMAASHTRAFEQVQDVVAALPLSPYFRLNVEVGRCAACAMDPIAYIRQYHTSVASVQLKDGPSVVEVVGNTSIRSVLELLSRERWPIRAVVECANNGRGAPVDEVKRCLTYVRQALS